MIKCIHGSSSASFEGVFNPDDPGLICTGQLIREGKAPFCGEMQDGIAHNGINQGLISFVPLNYAEYAIDFYALRIRGWDHNISSQILKDTDDELESLMNVSDLLAQTRKSALKNIRIIEKQRQDRWGRIKDEYKPLIKKPFPVLYRIDYEGTTTEVAPDISPEIVMPGPIRPDELRIYVPADQLQLTRSLAARCFQPTSINPFENLRDELEGIRSAAKSGIERLIAATRPPDDTPTPKSSSSIKSSLKDLLTIFDDMLKQHESK